MSQLLPPKITDLPSYSVPSQLFVCTAIFFMILFLGTLLIVITWIYRSCKHIYNYEYISDHEFMVYYKNKEDKIKEDEDPDDNSGSDQPSSSSRSSRYNVTAENRMKEYNRNQSRFLEFVSLSVVAVINVNAFSFNAFQLIAFGAALACFIVFNVLRVAEGKQLLRVIFLVPLIVAYIPFYVESKALNATST